MATRSAIFIGAVGQKRVNRSSKNSRTNSSSDTHWCWIRSARIPTAKYSRKQCRWLRPLPARSKRRNLCSIYYLLGHSPIVVRRAGGWRTPIRCWKSWRRSAPAPSRPSARWSTWCLTTFPPSAAVYASCWLGTNRGVNSLKSSKPLVSHCSF